jgi:hypothetical protein
VWGAPARAYCVAEVRIGEDAAEVAKRAPRGRRPGRGAQQVKRGAVATAPRDRLLPNNAQSAVVPCTEVRSPRTSTCSFANTGCPRSRAGARGGSVGGLRIRAGPNDRGDSRCRRHARRSTRWRCSISSRRAVDDPSRGAPPSRPRRERAGVLACPPAREAFYSVQLAAASEAETGEGDAEKREGRGFRHLSRRDLKVALPGPPWRPPDQRIGTTPTPACADSSDDAGSRKPAPIGQESPNKNPGARPGSLSDDLLRVSPQTRTRRPLRALNSPRAPRAKPNNAAVPGSGTVGGGAGVPTNNNDSAPSTALLHVAWKRTVVPAAKPARLTVPKV